MGWLFLDTKKKPVSRFLHSIDKYSKRKRLKIAEEIRQIEEDRLKKEELKIIRSAKELMMSELNGVRNAIFVKVSSVKSISIQRISQKKQEIEKEVFDSCELKIKEFTKSDKYKERLVKSINVASKILGSSMKIFSREQDIQNLNSFSEKFEICVSNKIKRGGLLFSANGMVLDDTFDTSIQTQKNIFSEQYFSDLI